MPHTFITPSDGRTHRYRQTSNISRALLGDKIVDRSDIVGAPPVGGKPGFNELGTDKCKTRGETV